MHWPDRRAVYCDPQAQSPSWPVPSPATRQLDSLSSLPRGLGWPSRRTWSQSRLPLTLPAPQAPSPHWLEMSPARAAMLHSSAVQSQMVRETVTPNVIITETSPTEMSHRDLLYRPIPALQMTFISLCFGHLHSDNLTITENCSRVPSALLCVHGSWLTLLLFPSNQSTLHPY